MSERLYVQNAGFAADSPCFCRSGQRFDSCCGSAAPQRPPPAGVVVVADFLSAADCAEFVSFAEGQKRAPLPVHRAGDDDGVETAYSDLRKTLTIQLDRRERAAVDWMRRACVEVVGPAFQAQVEWFEMPSVLRYGPGDLFARHADAEIFEPQTQRWFRSMNRDFSVLMYFNDDYQGGELVFSKFNYSYRPRAGDLVFFPANNLYLHEAKPVLSGRKYALASWGAVLGTPRVEGKSEARFFL